MVIHGKKIQFCEFLQNFLGQFPLGENLVFEVRKLILAPKILKKIIEVYFSTISDHAFFQDFWSQCEPRKNL